MRRLNCASTSWCRPLFLSLILAFFVPSLPAGSGHPQRDLRSRLLGIQTKVSPDLLEEIAFLQSHPEYDHRIQIIVRLKEQFDVSSIQVGESGTRQSILNSINGVVARMRGRQLLELAESGLIDYIAFDSPVYSTHGESGEEDFTLSNVNLQTTGADRAFDLGSDGNGVVVALFDSGIGRHPDLGRKQVLAAVDFTADRPRISKENADDFGHGTAMAGIIGGSGKASKGLYRGLASKVKFIDLKVIGEDGSGNISSVIQAVDWVIRYRRLFDIDIANLSLGKPPTDSYRNDLLCQAITKLLDNRIITVASGGNLGRTEGYPEIWGAITSPGIHPGVITAAAINTNGTLTHRDDRATLFASRGPTYLDGFFKPDIVAPGYKVPVPIPSRSQLSADMSSLQMDAFPRYFRMSGSSVSTAFITGTIALMLGANPEITPNLVRILLLQTAVKLTEPHILEQGNGLVNVLSAVDFAHSIDVRKREFWKTPIFSWSLDGEEVLIGGAIAIGNIIIKSPFAIEFEDVFWGSDLEWHNLGEFDKSEVELFDDYSWFISSRNLLIWEKEIFWPDSNRGILWSDFVLWTDSVLWVESVLWTDSIKSILWSDSAIVTDSTRSVLWTDILYSSGNSGMMGGNI